MKHKRKYIIGVVLLFIVGYLILDNILFDGIKPKAINENGFQANYYIKDGIKNKTTVILIGGGQWGDYWAQEFAKKEMAGLSLPYLAIAGLPKLPEEVELEYFEKAINWLRKQPEVNPNKVVVMGASKNAELALVLASIFTEHISAVVAYAPSSVSWSNTILPYSSDTIKASWTYKGLDIPYIPMNKFTGNQSNKIELLGYWKEGLAKTDLVEQAAIKVENINGPILLFSGIDDKVWPSSEMADMIEKRLKANQFEHAVQNIKYENAGHMISSNPGLKSDQRTGTISISGKDYKYEFGGNNEGDFKAKQNAKKTLIKFIEKL